jgi:hypothetical protein
MALYRFTGATLSRPLVIPPAKWTKRARRRARGRSRGRVCAPLVNVFMDDGAEALYPRLCIPKLVPFDMDVSSTLKGFDPKPLATALPTMTRKLVAGVDVQSKPTV